jgi:hypothetical protein
MNQKLNVCAETCWIIGLILLCVSLWIDSKLLMIPAFVLLVTSSIYIAAISIKTRKQQKEKSKDKTDETIGRL